MKLQQVAVVCGCVGGCMGLFAVVSGRKIPRAYKDLQLPHVPPITPDTLPADEILVRGLEKPPIAQSEVLLRAAREQETPKEELLRASQE